MPKECIINDKVRINYNDDLIFRYTFLPKSEIDLETAKEMVGIGDEWGKDLEKSCNMIDTRSMTFIGSEVRKYFASQTRSRLQAVAIVINSRFQGGLANLYMKFSKPVTPTKIFDDTAQAERWLKSFL